MDFLVLAMLDLGYDNDGGTKVVDVDVSSLRRKLGADAVQTVRGMGYRKPA